MRKQIFAGCFVVCVFFGCAAKKEGGVEASATPVQVQSVAKLDENSAKDLLQEFINSKIAAKQEFLLPIKDFGHNIIGQRTVVDYSQRNPGRSRAEDGFYHLYVAGYASRSADTRKYIDLGGDYTGAYGDPNWGAIPVKVHMDVDRGTGHITGMYEGVSSNGPTTCRGTFNGEVISESAAKMTDGTWATGPMSGFSSPCANFLQNFAYQRDWKIVNDGTKLNLVDQKTWVVPPLDLQLLGKPGEYTVTWYRYSWVPDKTMILNGEYYAPTGTVNVHSVSNLLLNTETTARAQFSYSWNKNELGKALLHGPDVITLGKAEFAKKPDGTWVATDASL